MARTPGETLGREPCAIPRQVSLGESWRTDQTLKRVPIIITANDLSTIYAPLLRDGRMDKFYFKVRLCVRGLLHLW